MPAVRRSDKILGIDENFEPFFGAALGDGEDFVLYGKMNMCIGDISNSEVAHSGLSNEIRDRQDFASVGIDISLIPAVDSLVLNLDGMHKGCGAVGLGEVLSGRRPLVVGTIEGRLNFRDERLSAQSWLGRGKFGYNNV